MKSKWEWSNADWRSYYEKLSARAGYRYQCSGESRYLREQLKYDVIVEALNKAIEYDDEKDNDRMRRIRNINDYMDRYTGKESFTKSEVMKIVNDIKVM